ncbi:SDR family NAD(P)-dependent oxidoreductase [Methylobacterium sp. J-070]|uniref:SDR family NAD(P)-dependent oxidoreductase n=1 Tax=Methylobacterium sp. J-070 TaxID=2836650 RepID=UPI001FB866F8|nr:SDR family oxidoreductase [Methylobacterium sp. J-070]MCJ2052044.1 SDR family oxidoreductase [Methylobacterium sp. J-070]
MTDPFSLDGKVALITGCGSQGPGWGNGKATAVTFARRGAAVYGVDLNAEAAEETRRLVEAEGGRFAVGIGSVTDRATVEGFVADCRARFGRLDILVNNVGLSIPGSPAVMTEEDWDAQIEINLKSAFLCTRSVLPGLVEQGGGAVVSIASTAAIRYSGKPQAAYAAAKAGLVQFSRVTAVEFAARGVRLNCVLPGLIETPLVERLARQFASAETGLDRDAFYRRRHQQPPMGRMGEAFDVAHAALYLASDAAKYVTGTEILVDGGLCATVPG